MKAIGSRLEGVDNPAPTAVSAVFLRCAAGDDVELMPRPCARALLEWATASPLLDVTGDLDRGFAWLVPGAHPRRSCTVIPLAAPAWPLTGYSTAVTIELWWPPDRNCARRIRSFVAWADDPYSAYLIACCLLTTAATGAGAEAAFLYGPDRRTAYRVRTAVRTYPQIPAATIARTAATAANRVSTDPLPDTPRTSAMHEVRIDGVLTYTGTMQEITACLEAHADSREASMDTPTARVLRTAAAEIENGARTEFQGMAHYRVVEAADVETDQI